jgi:hypothetical protein
MKARFALPIFVLVLMCALTQTALAQYDDLYYNPATDQDHYYPIAKAETAVARNTTLQQLMMVIIAKMMITIATILMRHVSVVSTIAIVISIMISMTIAQRLVATTIIPQ